LTAGSRAENIAALMDDLESASWPRRVCARTLEIAPRTPGYQYAVGAVRHDQRHGGGLLAGALAFRLFGALLPLALLVTVILGYATSVDHDAPKEAAEAVGLGTTVLESVGESARLSTGTRWSVVAFGVVALLWSASSAARAIRAVHSLAWEGRVGRVRRPFPAALVMLAAIGAFAAVIAGAGRARLRGAARQPRRTGRLRRDLAGPVVAASARERGLEGPHPRSAALRPRAAADPSRHRAVRRRSDPAFVGDLRLARRRVHDPLLAFRRQPCDRRVGDAQRGPRPRAEADPEGGASRMTQPLDLFVGSARLGLAVGREATRPVVMAVEVGQRLGARLALDALDALLASTFAEVAADRVLASAWTQRTLTQALGGPLPDLAAREIAQGAVLERVLDEVLATEVLDHIVDRAEQAGAVHRIADRVLADGLVERAAERFLAGPEFERLVVLTLDSPGVERAVASLFESRLLDQVVARLLSGPELWRVVDEVARSPAVTEAIQHQGVGFADQVAGEVRDRSRTADAVVERTTRRLLRRRPRMDPPAGPLPNPGTS
jgi:hypothetical protein